MEPLQYSIYKGIKGNNGAVQFNLQSPHWYYGKTKSYDGFDKDSNSIFEVINSKRKLKEGWKMREGAIFMNITSAIGPNTYDWENKIVIALSITDIGKVILSLLTGDECKIIHDPGAKSASQGLTKKFVNISSPEGPAVSVMLNVRESTGQNTKSHTVPISGDEVVVLKELLQTAVSRVLSW